MDRGAWWAVIHGVTESDTTERLSTQAKMPLSLVSSEARQVLKSRLHRARSCSETLQTLLQFRSRPELPNTEPFTPKASAPNTSTHDTRGCNGEVWSPRSFSRLYHLFLTLNFCIHFRIIFQLLQNQTCFLSAAFVLSSYFYLPLFICLLWF